MFKVGCLLYIHIYVYIYISSKNKRLKYYRYKYILTPPLFYPFYCIYSKMYSILHKFLWMLEYQHLFDLFVIRVCVEMNLNCMYTISKVNNSMSKLTTTKYPTKIMLFWIHEFMVTCMPNIEKAHECHYICNVLRLWSIAVLQQLHCEV